MSRVGRLAGALLAETEGAYFLVGNLKRPCDFPSAGFEPPDLQPDALVRPYVALRPAGPVTLAGPCLALPLEGEALPHLLSERLLIERNGSVSDRLWRLIVCADPDCDDPDPGTVIDARWLAEMPSHLWQVVRGAVLRCS